MSATRRVVAVCNTLQVIVFLVWVGWFVFGDPFKEPATPAPVSMPSNRWLDSTLAARDSVFASHLRQLDSNHAHTMRQLDTIGQESVRLEREANLQLREWKNLRNTRNKVGAQ